MVQTRTASTQKSVPANFGLDVIPAPFTTTVARLHFTLLIALNLGVLDMFLIDSKWNWPLNRATHLAKH